MTLTLGSLFDGIGGFALAGLQHGIQPLWAAEIEPFPIRVTQYRLPMMEHLGDITKLNGKDIPHVDILTGGFPCQDVSVAGRRAGLAGARSGLWWEFHRLIDEIRPTWVVIENVTGLMSSNTGRDLGTILKALDELGYVGAWRVLDAQYAGVPQRRRRIAIVGHLGDSWSAPAEVLLESESLCWPAPTYKGTRKDVAGTLGGGSGHRGWAVDTDRMTFVPMVFFPTNRQPEFGNISDQSPTVKVGSGGSSGNPPGVVHASDGFITQHYRKSRRAQHDEDYETWVEDEVTNTLNQFDVGDIRTTEIVVYAPEVAPTLRSASDPPATHGKANGVDRGTMIAYINGEPAEIQFEMPTEDTYWDGGQISDTLDLSQLVKGQMMPEKRRFPVAIQQDVMGWLRNHIMVRRLTPLECERLMGFPDGWTDVRDAKGKLAKDGPRYRALGNAIAIPPFQWILGNIAAYEEAQEADLAAD
jgi:DNA (cytosine-5)-methyltransferase 1